ncbi:hypothetical protein ALC60_08601 [Trachymyrmex zeteki]|uniref:DDE Tnp4 domain-containing protein n=1 Tax=Mycetomoellerius zeteki TaxID=64791 RepID=A0A151WWR6_9HYME|nr:hypothetical protein ALC60_08601 [Trachymyrmex zeteki]
MEEEERDKNRHRKKNLNIIRRSLRDTQDPFNILDNTFLKLYRLSKVATVQLIEELKHFMPVLQRRTAIPQHLQILIDGTHIAIFPSQTEREHFFINRKQYHSLNVMIVSIKIISGVRDTVLVYNLYI